MTGYDFTGYMLRERGTTEPAELAKLVSELSLVLNSMACECHPDMLHANAEALDLISKAQADAFRARQVLNGMTA